MIALFEHVIQSTACAGLAAILALTLWRAPARIRHTIWALASFKFLLPLSFLVALGQYLGPRTSPDASGDVSVAVRWLDRSWTVWGMPFTSGTPQFSDALGSPWAVALAVIWAIGCTTVARYRWREWHQMRAIERDATPLVDGREARLFRELTTAPDRRWRHATLHLRLLRTATTVEPGVFGVARPALLWPAALSPQLTNAELRAVLAHEICHVERRDTLVGLVHAVVEIVFWFNPVVWWLGRQIVAERERACDEEVLTMGMNGRSYAEAILKVCDFCLRPPAAFVAGVSGSELSRRITRIMTPSARQLPMWSAQALVVTAATFVLAAPLAAGARRGPTLLSPAPVLSEQTRPVFTPTKDSGIVLPKLVKEAKPRYTKEAMQAKIQGNVSLEVIVEVDGTVKQAKVVKSLDKEHGLDDEAVRAVKTWVFTPGTKDGKPVAVAVEIEMTFHLK